MLPERSTSALQPARILPNGALFRHNPMPPRVDHAAWGARKRIARDCADVVLLDPDSGVGGATEKCETSPKMRLLWSPATAIVFITVLARNHRMMLSPGA